MASALTVHGDPLTWDEREHRRLGWGYRKCRTQHADYFRMESGLLALARPGHIKNLDVVGGDKAGKLGSRITVLAADVNTRLLQILGELEGAQRPARYFFAEREDHRAIGVADVPLGALEVSG